MRKKKEVWVDADKGGFYEGQYEVSNWGRWKIIPRLVNSSWGIRMHIKEERITIGSNSNGYRCVMMKRDGIRKQVDLHTLVGKWFIPNPNNFPQILHKDDVRDNNYFENLEWGTQQKNIRDAVKRGRMVFTKGEQRSTSKLTEEKVREMRLKHRAENITVRKLAVMYGISYSVVGQILRFERWAHVK